jgi:hypothetical protein
MSPLDNICLDTLGVKEICLDTLRSDGRYCGVHCKDNICVQKKFTLTLYVQKGNVLVLLVQKADAVARVIWMTFVSIFSMGKENPRLED